MTRTGIAPLVVGLAVVFTAGCQDTTDDDAERTAEAIRAESVELRQEIRSSLDEFEAEIDRLDVRYSNVSNEVAEEWSETRSEMRRYREGLETDFARLEAAGDEEARRLRHEMAEDLERLTERLERAQLESIDGPGEFLIASRDRMTGLENELHALGDEAASLSEEARDEASDELEELRDRAEELRDRLEELGEASIEEIAEERTDITQEMSALAASVRRELFEMRQGLIDDSDA